MKAYGYIQHMSPALKTSEQGRASGGMIAYTRESAKFVIERIPLTSKQQAEQGHRIMRMRITGIGMHTGTSTELIHAYGPQSTKPDELNKTFSCLNEIMGSIPSKQK